MGLWLALIICILLSAFFSAAETAFSASNKVKLKTVEGRRRERAQTALALLDRYDSLLTTVLIGNNIVNIAGTAIATILFTTRILPGREDLAATVASAVMTVLVLFLGEVGPKTLAKQQPERFAMAVSPVMRGLVVVLHPLDLLFSLWRLQKAKKNEMLGLDIDAFRNAGCVCFKRMFWRFHCRSRYLGRNGKRSCRDHSR